MKTAIVTAVISIGALFSQEVSAASLQGERGLLGGWNLEEFVIISADKRESPFCIDASGSMRIAAICRSRSTAGQRQMI
jgi:hypothetical protein